MSAMAVLVKIWQMWSHMKQHNHISKASTQYMKTYCKCNLWLKVQLGSFIVDYPITSWFARNMKWSPPIWNSNKSKEIKFSQVLCPAFNKPAAYLDTV